jgi:hypothetical protein
VASEWVYRPGKTSADLAKVQAQGQALLQAVLVRYDAAHKTHTATQGLTINSIKTKGTALQTAWYTSPEYKTYTAALNAVGYYRMYTSISDTAATVFEVAVGSVVAGGAVLGVVGGVGGAGGGLSFGGIGETLSGAASSVGGAISSAAGSVSGVVGSLGGVGAIAGVAKKILGGHTNELSPVSEARKNPTAASSPITGDLNSALPLVAVAVIAALVLSRR